MTKLPVLAVVLEYCLMVHALPTVDPGLFVIMGVQTCGDGKGYCMWGQDCSLDADFSPDDRAGHCDGLRSAFTPSASFVCCRLSENSTTTEISDTTTDMNLNLQDTTIIPSRISDTKPEVHTKPKITTIRSYEVFEPTSELLPSPKDAVNKSSRLDDVNNNKPSQIKLEFVQNKVKNSILLKKKHRLDNADTNEQLKTGNRTMITEPLLCIPQPRNLSEMGPLRFPLCIPLSSSEFSTMQDRISAGKSDLNLGNEVRSSIEGNSTDKSSKQTGSYVDNKTEMSKSGVDNGISSVQSPDGLSGLVNADNANGIMYTLPFLEKAISNYEKKVMRSDNTSREVDGTVNSIYDLLTSLNVKSNNTRTNSQNITTVGTSSNLETSTEVISTEDDIDTSTEDISEYDKRVESSDYDYGDETSTTEGENILTTENYPEYDKNFSVPPPFTEEPDTSSETLTDDSQETKISTTTDPSDVGFTSTTPPKYEVSPVSSTTKQSSSSSSSSSSYSKTTPSTVTKPQEGLSSSKIRLSSTTTPQTPPVSSTNELPLSTETKDIKGSDSNPSPFSLQTVTPSSSLPNKPNKNSTSILISSPESSTFSVGTSSDSPIVPLTSIQSSLEIKPPLASSTTSGYDELSNTVPDDVTTSASPGDRVKGDGGVCIGGRRVVPGSNCWLVHFRDKRRNTTICPGAYLTSYMVISSASCAVRLYNLGPETVEVSFSDGKKRPQRIRDIIIHENYRPAHARPARYDMGVIRLVSTQIRQLQSCAVCVAEADMDLGVQRCLAVMANVTYTEGETRRGCKHVTPSGRHSGSVLTLCPKTSSTLQKIPSGSPLICNGMLAGVATTSNGEQAFTPINLFTSWIKKNQLIS